MGIRINDLYIDRIRDLLETNISEINGTDKKVVVLHNAKVKIKDTLDLLNSITEEHAKDVFGLGTML